MRQIAMYFVVGVVTALATAVLFALESLTRVRENGFSDDEAGMICAAFVIWPFAWFIGAIFGAGTLTMKSGRWIAAGLGVVVDRTERRRARRELEEKAQREIFKEVDRLLSESSADEIDAFMRQLGSAHAKA